MFHSVFDFFKRFRPARRFRHDLRSGDRFGEILFRSPVPGVTLIVLIWAVCALFLTLSVHRRREISWRVGQVATMPVFARCDFSYEDVGATLELRTAAEQNAPIWYHVDPDASEIIEGRFRRYLEGIAARASGRMFDGTTAAAVQANRASAELIDFLDKRRVELLNRVNRVINRGIMSDGERALNGIDRAIKVTDLNGNYNLETRTIGDYPDAEQAAKQIVGEHFFPQANVRLTREFIEAAKNLIGEDANLRPDPRATARARIAASRQIPPVIRNKSAQERILGKGEVVTETTLSMLEAEQRALPRDFGANILLFNLVGGMILLAIAAAYVVIGRPRMVRNPRQLAIAAIIICLSLWINFLAIRGFSECLHAGVLSLPPLLVCAIPVALPMILLSVTLGDWVAFSAGFLTSTITALMVLPDQQQQLELAVRWLLISGICTLVVRHVVSYRAFFIRTFFASVLLNGLFNLDLLYRSTGDLQLRVLAEMAKVVVTTGFGCAVLALVILFALELLFNLDTDMALTVLGNFNHPLLERLKREAPGTMFHSITVATLAEDAARAIGANPLRAKVGALFHDIGKLEMPQYFTENNRDSGEKHKLLAPRVSSIIIRDHVKNGLELAHKYRLFRYVCDAIASHHGDGLVSYFYRLAQKRQKENGAPENTVAESDFRYDGTPPHGKELTIISIADACEAASRSVSKPTEALIRALVDDIIEDRLRNGQLRNAALTLHELAVVRDCFVKTLVNINHGRIAYSNEEKHDALDARVENADSAGTGK